MTINKRAGRTKEVQQIFQSENEGAMPISAHDFSIKEIPIKAALIYNKNWHSRLPELKNYFCCNTAYAAVFNDKIYAVGIFGRPVARSFNGLPVFELRRFAICSEAPKNTASRMIKVMLLLLKKKLPTIEKVISYQDTEVHKGTIYKASGWKIGRITKASEVRWGKLNKDGSGRKRNPIVAVGDKIRWEYDYPK